MRLKSLQLIGFKSFVDKTEFNLEKGITCIVGPNGSGKSNIVDAIRWALGEMRPKNLRGEDMEDVIFNGSESRKPSGMAEVSLTFVADGRGMPAGYGDYNELMITRRVFRTGESEYFINKVPVRWRDVIDLFLDTGVGPKAYSIIEQGVVEKIIMAKPDERRLFFEEVAGISKYRMRKKEAIADMEATQQNLQRVEDVMTELKRQISSLDRQAKKAEKYRELMKELREKEFNLFLLQYRQTIQTIQKMEKELNELKDQEATLNSEIARLLAKYDESRIAIVDAEKRYNEINDSYYKIQGEIQKKDNDIKLLKRDLENAELNKNNLLNEIALLESEKKNLEQSRTVYENSLQELQTLLEGMRKREEEAVKGYNQLMEIVKRLKKDIEEKRGRLADAKAEESRLRNELVALEKDMDDRSRRIERLNSEINETKQKIGTADTGLKRVRDEQERLKIEISKLQEAIAKSRERMGSLDIEYNEKGEEIKKLNDRLVQLTSRYHTTKEMVENYEEFSRGVRSIMERQRMGDGKLNYRTVADILTIDEKYINALEAVLGEKLEYVVTSDLSSGIEAMEFLKGSNGGRATFIISGVRVTQNSTVHDLQNVVPMLSLVKYNPEYESVVSVLLQDVFLVEDPLRARELWQKEGNTATYVTLDGDVFMPRGIFSGGSKEGLEEGILRRRDELTKIETEIKEEEAILAFKREEMRRLQEEILKIRESISSDEKLLREKEIEFVNISNEVKSITEDISNFVASIEAREAEKSLVDVELKQFQTGHIEKLKKLQENEKIAEDIQKEISAEEVNLKELESKIIQINSELMAVKTEVASLREKLHATKLFIDSTSKQISEITGRIETKKKEIDSLTKFSSEAMGRINELEGELKNSLTTASSLEEGVRRAREEYEKLTVSCSNLEKELDTKRKLLEETKEKITKLTLGVSEQRMASEFLRTSAQDKCQKDLEEFRDTVVSETSEELESRINELQEKVSSMGEINLVAAEEYRELTERFNFLNTQKEDLLKSLANLREAINKINKTSREKFLETFQSVNAKFKEVFPKFFDGGRAELYLTNEHEVLESGIEVFAQPPGKKLQNIGLLSGGEKALTGIAIIFSFFLNKPSPFCILDEADAPLDEASLRRFLTMVKELNRDIQFIIITHNKLTMEIADSLYGITMEEAGISRVISVKLN